MELIADRLFRYRDKLRKQKRKSWWEKAKPYVKMSLVILVILLLIISVIHYFFYKSLYSI